MCGVMSQTSAVDDPQISFEAVVVEGNGTESRVPLSVLQKVALESGRPVRRFPSYRGQRNFPGLYWSATMDRHVGFESWVERDHLIALDFDRFVVGIASQPFWLVWTAQDGTRRRHAPDFFARLADGGALVVDSRPLDRIAERDAVAFAATEVACRRIGWRYAVWGTSDPVGAANLRWLSGYRHPRCYDRSVAGALRDAFALPRTVLSDRLLAEVGGVDHG
jgi:hypothetical protein